MWRLRALASCLLNFLSDLLRSVLSFSAGLTSSTQNRDRQAQHPLGLAKTRTGNNIFRIPQTGDSILVDDTEASSNLGIYLSGREGVLQVAYEPCIQLAWIFSIKKPEKMIIDAVQAVAISDIIDIKSCNII